MHSKSCAKQTSFAKCTNKTSERQTDSAQHESDTDMQHEYKNLSIGRNAPRVLRKKCASEHRYTSAAAKAVADAANEARAKKTPKKKVTM
jgi:hypothetical protein